MSRMDRGVGGRRLGCLIALAMFAVAPGAYALDADQVFDKVSASVVLVSARRNNVETIGSGVAVGRERVVTACNVVTARQELMVKWGETKLPATLEHADAERDLCLLLVPRLRAPAPDFAPLRTARIGQRVYAIGNPEGLELTLSDGPISAIRILRGFGFIQTSAPVAHGSSGGGLFDSEGRLIGITMVGDKEGIGLNFAISADEITGNPAFAALLVEPPTPPIQASAEEQQFPRALPAAQILAHFQRFPEVDANADHPSPFKLKVSFRRSSSGIAERRCPKCRRTFDYGKVTLMRSQDMVCFDWYKVSYPEGGCFRLIQVDEKKFVLQPAQGKREITYVVRR